MGVGQHGKVAERGGGRKGGDSAGGGRGGGGGIRSALRTTSRGYIRVMEANVRVGKAGFRVGAVICFFEANHAKNGKLRFEVCGPVSESGRGSCPDGPFPLRVISRARACPSVYPGRATSVRVVSAPSGSRRTRRLTSGGGGGGGGDGGGGGRNSSGSSGSCRAAAAAKWRGGRGGVAPPATPSPSHTVVGRGHWGWACGRHHRPDPARNGTARATADRATAVRAARPGP